MSPNTPSDSPTPEPLCPICRREADYHYAGDFANCKPELERELAFGVYEATPAFKSIEKHSCVCYKNDLGLVAVTGPAEDKLSQKYAELFASAPILASRVKELEAALEPLARIPCKDTWKDHESLIVNVNVGDIRHARELIGKGKS